MKILVSGATGFVGRYLVPSLLKEGHIITVLGRDAEKINSIFNKSVHCLSWANLDSISPDEFDVVINLSGENIAQIRWTEKSKIRIKESRVSTTARIIHWCLKAKKKKPHLYNTSAIGIYGLQREENTFSSPITESNFISPRRPTDFLSEVATAWEAAVKPAVSAHFPVTIMRFGVVLKRHEGVLKKLEFPFFIGFGSVLGSGNQSFSWIHIEDLIRAILFLMKHPQITGPVNLTAPECIPQKIFAKTLANIMKRPLILKIPKPVIEVLFGQMGQELLLGGQHAYPETLKKFGFEFLYPNISSALAHDWS